MHRLTFSAAALAFLAACQPGSPGYSSFNSEAGSVETTSVFGTAVIENYMTQVDPAQARHALATRFAAEVDSTVTFAFNSAQLDAQAQAILRRQATWIRQFPELRFSVYGHTDLVGSDSYNYQLGLRRANAVVNYLGSLGISRSRLEALVSYGEQQPLIVTQDRERANRRTVTEVSGFVDAGDGSHCCLNGQYAEIIFRDYVASAEPPPRLDGVTGEGLTTGE
ncbi:OmpA family protein [Wenxinia marina]|uniref:Outer membrane protein n=1 Tax=Wenxinia marina DSM 24838 TaxID=1123501 RepID=A0A0D0Q683_9RHOB|nr:OmpA family protein [Wenxinia marina]KIQ67972.1 Outer membrane protein [Wenxinia marina DSM 24838]GGL75810.1 hypothetical protein GCM10011392_32970 [Wenxinia marina]